MDFDKDELDSGIAELLEENKMIHHVTDTERAQAAEIARLRERVAELEALYGEGRPDETPDYRSPLEQAADEAHARRRRELRGD